MMKAEALWRLNNSDQSALALVNLIRNRAGLDDFTSLTAEDLLAERGREFFYEYWRRQDLIRFKKFTDAWAFQTGVRTLQRAVSDSAFSFE